MKRPSRLMMIQISRVVCFGRKLGAGGLLGWWVCPEHATAGPRCDFENCSPPVFLAGGIGVTPIRSILFHTAKQRLQHRIFFFFSNRRPEDAPFLADLQTLQKENPNYTCTPSMTQMAKSHHHWSGETGFINKDLLAKYLGAAKSPIYYIVGPQKMVSGLHTMINESRI